MSSPLGQTLDWKPERVRCMTVVYQGRGFRLEGAIACLGARAYHWIVYELDGRGVALSCVNGDADDLDLAKHAAAAAFLRSLRGRGDPSPKPTAHVLAGALSRAARR